MRSRRPRAGRTRPIGQRSRVGARSGKAQITCPPNPANCTIASLALAGGYIGVGVTGLASVGELGINVFADAGFIGAFEGWLAAYAAWDSACFP